MLSGGGQMQRPHIALFLLYEASSTDQSIEMESKLVVARDQGERGWGFTPSGYRWGGVFCFFP